MSYNQCRYPFNFRKFYADHSTNELKRLLKKAEEFSECYPDLHDGRHNEYIQALKMLITERIGR